MTLITQYKFDIPGNKGQGPLARGSVVLEYPQEDTILAPLKATNTLPVWDGTASPVSAYPGSLIKAVLCLTYYGTNRDTAVTAGTVADLELSALDALSPVNIDLIRWNLSDTHSYLAHVPTALPVSLVLGLDATSPPASYNHLIVKENGADVQLTLWGTQPATITMNDIWLEHHNCLCTAFNRECPK